MFLDDFNLILFEENKNMYFYQQNLIKKYIDSKDVNIIIQIAVLISTSPVADYIEAINILKKLSLVTNNINVCILGSYLMNEYVFDEENYFITMLDKFLNSSISQNNKSIVYYLLGKHFKKISQIEKSIYCFKKSIEYNSKSVNNWLELSELLPQYKKDYYNIAKSNVKYVLSDNDLSEKTLDYFTSFDNFVEEYILGVRLTEPIYNFYFVENNTGDDAEH